MFTLRMLPARHGDALWIEYGDRPHRILIDGGPSSRTTAGHLRDLLSTAEDTGLDLLVVTHIDADHITGILNLLEDREVAIDPVDVWFNGWDHLPSDLLGAKQAENLTTAIRRRRLNWNAAFDERAVVVLDDGPLPRVRLDGGMELILLSPTRAGLADLRPVWKREVEAAGLVPGFGAVEAEAHPDLLGEHAVDLEELAEEPFETDDSEANGASIAFIAAFDGRRLLATGDAHAPTLAAGLRRLAEEDGTDRIAVDAVKLPHHGSKYNLSPELLELLDCDRFLFSTNGAIYRHPDPVAIARIVAVRDGTELVFNYEADTTRRWGSRRLQRRFDYRATYPDGEPGATVTI